MTRLVNQAIDNAQNKPPVDTNALEKDGQMRAIEGALADKIYQRVITEGYYRPTWTSTYYRPSYPVYRPYVSSTSLDSEIRRILSYHTYVNSYESINKVLGHTLDPKLQEIIGVLYDLVNKKDGAAAKPAAANATKNATAKAQIATKSLIQTEEQGVPVHIDPILMRNSMSEADLSQRDYVIDGVNGIGFVQTEKKDDDDSLSLNLAGVKVDVTGSD